MADKDVTIAQLVLNVDLLRCHVQRLEQANGELQQENQRLRDQIARLNKDSHNSSKPPSSDIVKPPKPKLPKGQTRRKQGAQPGHDKHQREAFPPDQVDRTVDHELPFHQARGVVRLDSWQIVQQVDLLVKPFEVVEHRVRQYLNLRTGQVLTTPLPAEVAEGGLLGPRLTALVAFQKAACHMSYTTIQQFFHEVLGLTICRGQLAKTVSKVSGALEVPYDQVYQALRDQDHLGIDETGHKDQGDLMWTWCFDAPTFTVFRIDPSRGSAVLRLVLGEMFGGSIGCDYYTAYRKYVGDTAVLVQYCMAHLIREIRFLAESGVDRVRRWAQRLLNLLKAMFGTLHRRQSLTVRRFDRRMEGLRRMFLRRVRRPPADKPATQLARRFRRAAAQRYFLFLTKPGVEPTNNGTERAIRQVVIDRRVTQGTRGNRGQRWWERIWTVLATCRKQGRNGYQFIQETLLAYWMGLPCPSLLTQEL